jgi:hypothetical protein
MLWFMYDPKRTMIYRNEAEVTLCGSLRVGPIFLNEFK